MKRLISIFLLLLVGSLSTNLAFALIVTDNVDKDDFRYEVTYTFSTQDLAVSQTAMEVPIDTSFVHDNFVYAISRDGRLVGMSIAGDQACTAGAATFDITINSQVTGIQTVIEPAPVRSAVGIGGASGTTYAYIRQDRADTVVSRGFRGADDKSTSFHNTEHQFGRATPLVAGNRVGVRVTTSSAFAPVDSAYVIVVYVLE